MLQVRLSLPEFSNGVNFSDPIIMENAGNITLSKTINSSDERLSFELPSNDAKISYVNYLRWWECWDTETNTRLNYGPINTIAHSSGDNKKIEGPGRSALLLDYTKSVQTFYYPLNRFFDDLRYENMTAQPRTSTIIKQNTSSEYYGLSKRSKDNAIDEQTGFIAIGRDTPKQGTKKTDSIWSGTGKSDYLIVDLGDDYVISKVKLLLPWWGGATVTNRRTYDWTLLSSNDNSSYTTEYSELLGVYGEIMLPDVHFDGRVIYFGETGFETSKVIAEPTAITKRYFKIDISNTYAKARIATPTTGTSEIVDVWDWECGGSNIFNGDTRTSPTVSTGDLIDKEIIVPASNCHASIVEVGVYKKILGKDTISQLAYHQIDDTSRQVNFYHVPAAAETFAADSARKFEPGGFFRKVTITTGSTVTAYDEYNVPVYVGGSGTINCPANTRFLKFTGSGDVQVVYADTWPRVLDAYSYSGSYSYSEITNDYVILDVRGVSLKWFATVPSGKTPGTVKIEYRSKNSSGVWTSWSTLEASLTLPANIAGEKVWEITYESGLMQDETSYQVKITNLDGNFVSIDSFTGYWSGSFTHYNEDDDRMNTRHPDLVKQRYDQRFSGGSIHEFVRNSTNLNIQAQISFEGDRAIVYGRKGPGYGVIKIYLSGIVIPGGDADGGVQIDTDHPYDIAQAIIFDSADYFTDPDDALPWGRYNLQYYRLGGTTNIWLDGVGVHEASGLSTKFLNTTYQEILDSTVKAIQLEWDITEAGIKIVPRLGVDTDIIFAEGRGTTIKVENVEDVSQIASQLVVSGADIEGLPLSAIVEDKKTRRDFNRTIQRTYDIRNVADYFTLIGAARTELLRRREPQKRITIVTTDIQGVTYGDSFIIKTPELETRARAMTITRNQSSSGGTTYTMDCLIWPQII